MFSGDVVGMIISSRKHDALIGYKLLKIRLACEQSLWQEVIAVDKIGAGVGDRVLVVTGSAARIATDAGAPVDAAVVGIIDPS